jgi:hypothetical protein
MDPATLHAFMEQRRKQLAESPLAQQVGEARLLGSYRESREKEKLLLDIVT